MGMDIFRVMKKLKKLKDDAILLVIFLMVAIALFMMMGSCSDDVLFLEQEGTLTIDTRFINFETARVDVPECAKEDPTHIKVRLINESGFAFTEYALYDGEVLEEITFPVGAYSVDEISLVTEDNSLTHTVPSTLDSRFNFAAYTQRPLPYSINITPNQNTDIFAELMCYTERVIEPQYDWYIGIVELQTLAFNLPETSCIDEIRMLVNTDEREVEINIPLSKFGLYLIPIPKEFNYVNIAIRNQGVTYQSFAVIPSTVNEVVQIDDKCF